ncbi:unknown [Clostridium sp. CAG:122]|nr:unknown [Clostridium sp. CAG:122]
MYHTHSKLSFILFFCNIKSSKKYHIKTAANLSAVFITMLITFFIITPPIQTFCHTKTDNTNISTVFSSDAVKQTLTLSETHYMLTNSAQLKQNILYKDTIKNNSVNYYYINNPAATNLFCIKCVSGKLTTNEIQFFDDTNNEININIIRQQNYFYINIKKLFAKAPSATRIYITAGSRKTSNIEIIYTKNITTPKRNNNNNNADKKGIAKRNTQKSITKSNTKKKTYKKDTKKRIIKKAANKEDTKTHATKKSTTKKAPAKNKKNITAIHKKTVQKSKPKKNNIHNQNNKSRRKTNNNAAAKKSNKNKIAHHKTTDKNKSKNNIAHHKITDKNKTKNQNVNNKYVKFNTKFITLKSTKNTFLTYRTNIKITNKTKIIWTSSNTNIVSTNKHKITAHHKGLAIITLTIKDRTVCKKAICTIRVT